VTPAVRSSQKTEARAREVRVAWSVRALLCTGRMRVSILWLTSALLALAAVACAGVGGG
jgi:hypothetical protein